MSAGSQDSSQPSNGDRSGAASARHTRREWKPRAGTSKTFEFARTSVLVAGASGGLGSAIAEELNLRGAELTLIGRTERTIAALAVPGTRIALDLRSPESCSRAVEMVMERSGHLDVVVNATGVVAFGNVQELSVDTLEELMLTNTVLPVLLAKAALPHLPRGGVITNISGVIAEKNLPGMAAYGASKAALRAFDEAFAREARRVGVKVLDARPPHTETDLMRHPIEGSAPKLPAGLDASHVAGVICDAIARGATDLGSEAFAMPADAGAQETRRTDHAEATS